MRDQSEQLAWWSCGWNEVVSPVDKMPMSCLRICEVRSREICPRIDGCSHINGFIVRKDETFQVCARSSTLKRDRFYELQSWILANHLKREIPPPPNRPTHPCPPPPTICRPFVKRAWNVLTVGTMTRGSTSCCNTHGGDRTTWRTGCWLSWESFSREGIVVTSIFDRLSTCTNDWLAGSMFMFTASVVSIDAEKSSEKASIINEGLWSNRFVRLNSPIS